MLQTCSKENSVIAPVLRGLIMSINIGHKESPAAVLSAVTAEMAKPRVVESAKGAKTRKEHAAPAKSARKKRLFRSAVVSGSRTRAVL
jgi:hypothetical protein